MSGRRILAALLCAALLLACLAACSAQRTPDDAQGDKLRVVAVIFPAYDWAREVLGAQADNVELTLLLDGGVDLHSYQPTAADLLKLTTCDLLLYVGGESDDWVRDALREAANPDLTAISLLDTIGDAAKTEETVEGMHAEAEDEPELDEHVWLSLRNARVCVDAIADALAALDGEHADVYAANAAAYGEKLAALDAAYQAAVDGAAQRTLLFADRFPFRYLTDDYGLRYYAAFPGCSAETEASFETIAFLAEKVDELGLRAVLVIDGGDRRIAETVVRSTKTRDQQILTLDSMQSAGADSAPYLAVMESNLAVLRTALQ